MILPVVPPHSHLLHLLCVQSSPLLWLSYFPPGTSHPEPPIISAHHPQGTTSRHAGVSSSRASEWTQECRDYHTLSRGSQNPRGIAWPPGPKPNVCARRSGPKLNIYAWLSGPQACLPSLALFCPRVMQWRNEVGKNMESQC